MWSVVLSSQVEAWLDGADDMTYGQVVAAINALRQSGPTLGRPLVERIRHSRIHNLKELPKKCMCGTLRRGAYDHV